MCGVISEYSDSGKVGVVDTCAVCICCKGGVREMVKKLTPN